jgi:predicted nucleic acid-binding protein
VNGWLFVTNALSHLRRPAQNRQLVDFVCVQPAEVLHCSSVSFAEIRYGIELQPDPEKRAGLTDWLESVLRPRFDGRVHEVDEHVLLRWLLINRRRRERGHSFSQQDSLIAAVAAVHQLVVVTGDETHFVAAGVPVLDPWSSRYYAGGTVTTIENLVSANLLSGLPN